MVGKSLSHQQSNSMLVHFLKAFLIFTGLTGMVGIWDSILRWQATYHVEIAVHTCPPIASGYSTCFTQASGHFSYEREGTLKWWNHSHKTYSTFLYPPISKKKNSEGRFRWKHPPTRDPWFRQFGLLGSLNLVFNLPISSCQILKFFVTLDTELLWGLLRTSKMVYCGEFYLSSVLSFPYLGRRFVSALAYSASRKVEQIEVQIQEEIQPPPVVQC